MRNSNSIGQKYNVMKNVKDPIGNYTSQVRCDRDCQKKGEYDITRNHDLTCKFGTEGIISITAIYPKEHQKYDNCTEEHEDKSISNGNVAFEHLIERYDVIEDSGGSFGNDEATHGDWEHSKLKQNCMHCAKFEGRDSNFPAVARSSFGYLFFLASEFFKCKVGFDWQQITIVLNNEC